MIRKFLFSYLLTVGLNQFQIRQAHAQVIWEPIETPKDQNSSVIWKNDAEKPDKAPAQWNFVPAREDPNQSSSGVIWKVLEAEDEELNHPSQQSSNSEFTAPSSLEEAEALLGMIPLQQSDYQPLLRLSPLISTAETLPMGQWSVNFGMISALESNTGTSHHNYSVNLDLGVKNNILLSFFASQADDPLNTPLTGFATQPSNFWQSYGAAARWQTLNQNNWKMAISSSLESWEVGSGGDRSFAHAGDNASPNIFNDSGVQVLTRNIVGSLSLPVTWQANNEWQFSFTSGVSFLPAKQGSGQGGAGEFYGTNPYIGGGILFQPSSELGLTVSLAQPIGRGNNSFDANLKFSRVPIYSAGINWNLNPRVGLQGIITNGFGATPATALLTLPSDNRLGYSASFVYTPGTADTPQVSLTPRQKTLAKGGLTVNTALVPANESILAWINADNDNNFNQFIGYSISNVAQLNLFSSGSYNNVPQTTEHARYFANDSSWNWNVGCKAVAFSPLRGAPFWGSGYIGMGRTIDETNQRAPGYLFAETIATLELSDKIAFNFNPKLAWSGIENLWGVGLSSNIQLTPRLEFIPEANIVMGKLSQTNATLGIRWHATEKFSIDFYTSTAASIREIGQLISSERLRWGARLILSF